MFLSARNVTSPIQFLRHLTSLLAKLINCDLVYTERKERRHESQFCRTFSHIRKFTKLSVTPVKSLAPTRSIFSNCRSLRYQHSHIIETFKKLSYCEENVSHPPDMTLPSLFLSFLQQQATDRKNERFNGTTASKSRESGNQFSEAFSIPN